jgi:hypothetical protein
MLKMRCVVVDTLEEIGGQCAALYPEKPIFDIPAHPRIAGADLVAQLAEQALPFSPHYLLGQRVDSLQPDAEGFTLRTSAGQAIRAKAVILAAGAGAFGPNRPPLDHLPGYEASGAVRYMVGRREELRGKRVVIAGGGDSAVDWALSLKDIAEVTVVHRRPKFRAAPRAPPSSKPPRRAARSAWRSPTSSTRWRATAQPSRRGAGHAEGRGDARPGRPPAGLLRALDGTRPDRRMGLGLEHKHVVVSRPPAAPASPASTPSATSRPIRAS